MSQKNIGNKIIVFDMDETLGYFSEFGIFYDALERYIKKNITPQQFFKLFDIYSNILLRPNIIEILRYTVNMKKSKIINKILIYTNNQGGNFWVNIMINYIQNKVGMGKIFDQIIKAYKINNKQIELCRTTHSKTYNDLVVNCCKLPKNTKVCFIDDQRHPYMQNNSNVYYIKIKPYVHSLQPFEFANKLLSSKSSLSSLITKENHFIEYINNYFNSIKYYKYSPKTKKEISIDKLISNELMNLIKNFKTF
tara:strand:+ start:9416 stop:10168 length:753 start_codon:yes stop_codon:yes gene_type:complete